MGEQSREDDRGRRTTRKWQCSTYADRMNSAYRASWSWCMIYHEWHQTTSRGQFENFAWSGGCLSKVGLFSSRPSLAKVFAIITFDRLAVDVNVYTAAFPPLEVCSALRITWWRVQRRKASMA